jgi:hypothetical protein
MLIMRSQSNITPDESINGMERRNIFIKATEIKIRNQ